MAAHAFPGAGIIVERNVPVPMRDGVVLRADIYRPAGEERRPVLLLRLPYNKDIAQSYVYAHPAWYAQQGYVVVVQDTRGRFASEGEFYPLRKEATDGFDTIEWCAALPYTNGRVGTYGFSYPGINQLLAAAERPPHLVTACPAFCPAGFYEGCAYVGGAFSLALMESWTVQMAAEAAHRRGERATEAELRTADRVIEQWYPWLPLKDFPPLKKVGLMPHFFDFLQHPAHDDFWHEWDLEPRYQNIQLPCLHIGGWYDTFISGTVLNYERLSALNQAEQRLLVGPWYHLPWSQHTGALDFGDEARNLVSEYQLAWFDAWLKADRRKLEALPRVRLFIMGENRWQDASQWPLPGTEYWPFYLHSGGRANSLSGDGSLSTSPPAQEPPDIYVYDPHDPVPSLGGHSCCYPDRSPMGPADQRPVETRNDVLVYTSEALTRPLKIAGRISATIWAATTARDTDFTVKVCDVFPDGQAINLTEGIIRGRYRESRERELLLEPHRVYRFDIDVGVTANVFQPGHRLRVEVSSSNFPAFDRNPNTGGPFGEDEEFDLTPATQMVFHSAQYPSHLSLPVVKE